MMAATSVPTIAEVEAAVEPLTKIRRLEVIGPRESDARYGLRVDAYLLNEACTLRVAHLGFFFWPTADEAFGYVHHLSSETEVTDLAEWVAGVAAERTILTAT